MIAPHVLLQVLLQVLLVCEASHIERSALHLPFGSDPWRRRLLLPHSLQDAIVRHYGLAQVISSSSWSHFYFFCMLLTIQLAVILLRALSMGHS